MWKTRDPNRFVVGVNLPWVGYGTDIGASGWYPDGGLARQPAALATLDRTFAMLAGDGISVARVFLLCDLRSGVQFDADEIPVAIDHAVIRDLAALVEAARRHGVRLLPALLDFYLCGPRKTETGVELGGRSRLIADQDASERLVDRVVRPLVEAFGADDTIAAWDVINEPEWCLGGMFSPHLAVPFEAMRRFLATAVDCIHRSASQPVTVGSAGTWNLDLVRDLDLDFYQIHWYDKFGWAALTTPVADLALGGRPVILGEFSGRTPRPDDVLDAARQAGYEGALVWSVLSDDDHSAYPAELVDWVRNAP